MFRLKAWLVVAVSLAAVPHATGAEPESPFLVYPVTGRVLTEPGGKPVAGVLVTLWNGSGGGRWTARTDAKGAYSFPDNKPGDYYKVWIEERPNKEAGTWSEGVGVRVKDRPVQADDLFVQLPQSLSGTVTDADTGKPVAGAEINFSTADRNRQGVTTDSRGRYRLFVTPRDVDLYCSGTADRYGEAEQRHQVAVGAGKHIKDIDFKVKCAPPFTGLVVLPDGKPAKGVDVLVEIRWVPLIPAGGFGGVACGGDYRLKTDDEGQFRGYMRGVLGQGGAKTVDLKATARPLDHRTGGTVSAKTTALDEYRLDPMKIVLARSAGFLVHVLDPDGRPVRNAQVTASSYPGWDDGLGGPVKHVGDGKYLMTGLIPGFKYRVTVAAPGLRNAIHLNDLVLKEDEVREVADARLEWWGKKAVPGLVKKLQSPDMYERELAAALLGELGAEAADAVPGLVEKLNKDPRNTVRFGVAAALGKIGPAAKASVPDLIKALQEDTGGGVQREAATALGLIGDLSATPALKVALEHVDSDISKAAAEAIKRLEEAARRQPQSR
jgi:protocatechuate 3,4-dioxygenase beta subunit